MQINFRIIFHFFSYFRLIRIVEWFILIIIVFLDENELKIKFLKKKTNIFYFSSTMAKLS
jgi:hypothetical protein